jgi:hypothetical protein
MSGRPAVESASSTALGAWSCRGRVTAPPPRIPESDLVHLGQRGGSISRTEPRPTSRNVNGRRAQTALRIAFAARQPRIGRETASSSGNPFAAGLAPSRAVYRQRGPRPEPLLELRLGRVRWQSGNGPVELERVHSLHDGTLTVLEVTGAHNIFRNCKLLERHVINGSFNELWNPVNSCPRVDFNGSQNLLHSPAPIFGSGISRLVYA